MVLWYVNWTDVTVWHIDHDAASLTVSVLAVAIIPLQTRTRRVAQYTSMIYLRDTEALSLVWTAIYC